MTRRDFAAGLTAGIGFLARASTQIATVAVTLVATRYLDPTEFGVFALASIAITLIRTFLYSGAFEYLLKAPDAGDCSSESLAVNMAIATGFSLLIGIGALAAQTWFGAGGIAAVLLALLPSNLISALAAWREALLLRTQRLRLYYALTSMAELVAMAAAIAMLFLGFKVGALVWQVYVRNLATLLLYLLIGPGTLSRQFSSARFMLVWRWSISRYAGVLLGFATASGVDLFLGILLSPAATGLYRASSRIVTAVADMFSQPARTIAMTLFSARAAAGRRSDTLWPAFFAVTASFGWAALAGLAAVAPLIVPAMLGEQWRAAAALVPILCLARASSLFDTVAAAALVAYDEQRPLFYVQLATSVLGLLLLVAVARFGLVAATIASFAGAVAGSTMIGAIAVRRLPGSGRALAGIAPALAWPVLATLGGAFAGRAGAAAAGLGATQATVLAVSCGLVAWIAALLLIRHRAADMIATLRGEPPETPADDGAVPLPAA